MTELTRGGTRKWRNEHRSLSYWMDRTVAIAQIAGPDCVADLQRRRSVLGALIADEVERGNPLAVTGSSWSQSPLIARGATWIGTEDDQAIWELPADAFHGGIENSRRYVLVAGGTKIATLMDWLDPQGLSLRTAGSHKGQSVAGMLATGSHGSMLGRSGFECHVKALLLATGRDEAQWLAAEPVLHDDFVSRFATIADPALFAPALVHLGGMGLVSAVLIKAEDAFTLGRIKRARVLPSVWAQSCAAGDFAAATGEERNPAYYEVTLDPFRGPDHEALETLWYRNDGAPLAPMADPEERHILDIIGENLTKAYAARIAKGPSEGMIDQWLIDVPEMTWEDFKEHETADEPDATYRLSQLVAAWKPHMLYDLLRIDVYNAAFAVPLERLPETLEIAFALGRGDDPKLDHDFVYTVRFAERSPAAMGFLRFERNAVINIDGLTKRFILGSDADDAAQELTRRFEEAGLPFSMHWGKDAPSDAAKVSRDFGSAARAYRDARAALLGDKARLFASPALAAWGLA